MSSFHDHPQYQFLKEAGMTEREINDFFRKDLGLRKRREQHRDAHVKDHLLSSSTFKPLKVAAREVERKMAESIYDFQHDYLEFMGSRSEKKEISLNIALLFTLMSKVNEEKGIIEVLSLGKWSQTVLQLKGSNEQFEPYNDQQLLKLYLEYLVEYQFYLKGDKLNCKKGIDITATLRIPVILKGELKEVVQKWPKDLKWYDVDIMIFQNGLEDIGLKYEEVDLSLLQSSCGNQRVDIRIQNPLDYGFNARKLTNIKHEMTLSEYCEYQKICTDQPMKRLKYGEQLSNGKIFFAVNFQPESSYIATLLQRHTNNTFLGYKQDFDLLSYLDDEIPGCSNPQFYLKVKGCWTGGHQENVNMCAVNINHGPGASEWFSIAFQDVQSIRAVLKEKFKIDLYLNQGLWFEKINWFIEQGFPIKRIVQKKGDIVVSGPGTLHWVRSLGVTLQSAWNLYPKTYRQIWVSLHRHRQNYQLQFQKSNTIPLKSLLLKYLEREYHSMEERMLELIVLGLESWLMQEEKLKIQLKLQSSREVVESLKDLQSFCEVCHQEVLNYFVSSWKGQGIACLECLQKNPLVQPSYGAILYQKYHKFSIMELFQVAKRRDVYSVGMTSICSDVHVGQVPIYVQRQSGFDIKTIRSYEAEFVSLAVQYMDSEGNKEIIEKVKGLFMRNEKGAIQQMAALFPIQEQVPVRESAIEIQTDLDQEQCPKCNTIYEQKWWEPRKKRHIEEMVDERQQTEVKKSRPEERDDRRQQNYKKQSSYYDNYKDSKYHRGEHRKDNKGKSKSRDGSREGRYDNGRSNQRGIWNNDNRKDGRGQNGYNYRESQQQQRSNYQQNRSSNANGAGRQQNHRSNNNGNWDRGQRDNSNNNNWNAGHRDNNSNNNRDRGHRDNNSNNDWNRGGNSSRNHQESNYSSNNRNDQKEVSNAEHSEIQY